MSIRRSNKDHLRELAPSLSVVEVDVGAESVEDDPLFFVTRHGTKPCSVDLHLFSEGRARSRSNTSNWRGPFSGRPQLILELAPAIKDRLISATEATCTKYIKDLKAWWRFFDRVELPDPATGRALARVCSVKDLTDLHGQLALDVGISRNTFSTFRALSDDTRLALSLRALHWQAPEAQSPKRHLPHADKIGRIWNGLKRQWYAALDRWSHAEALVAGRALPCNEADELHLENYRHFVNTRGSLTNGKTHPLPGDLKRLYKARRYPKGVFPAAMYSGFYPTAWDIRAAFHLCLAGSGWNPQTLLDLSVDVAEDAPTRTPFLLVHPSDPTRYVLEGYKERGNSDHILYGDWKTDRSPGAVLRAVVERTWPMRQEILRRLASAEAQLASARAGKVATETIESFRKQATELKQASRSAWLYFDGTDINWLTTKTYYLLGEARYLRLVIDLVNAPLSVESRCPYIVAGDFRDAFAAYVWRSTGGSILHVMAALKHRQARTTGTYLDNTVVNDESAAVFQSFGNTLWGQVQESRRIDPTLLAKLTRDGSATSIELVRLEDYRSLKRSRIGLACRDPLHPPENIDPNFVADGVSQCQVQRCTLCLTHGIITEQSLSGLAMRLAELRWLKAHVPFDSFVLREFQQELENTEVALRAFAPAKADAEVATWEGRIERGEHRVLEFDGLQRRAAGAAS
jgi:hypothetical protein